ncbi:ATP phosphoribosyltransferase regulatory subunit [Thiohalorhabdus sp. Cl-TMA]|uniref:ATP phosphoribosyltransferase regulatory subunit n=2 Tax=Thiohalorhabdus methylotrophus TaxID=3242694 RepID=A0ABV4TYC7_9GAMM
MNRWLLPQGIEDVLPERAEAIEGLRRRVLDLYHRWGYALIMPPEVEFLDSLLTGVGGDLSLRTMKVVDQASGHLMGFRADMTPQVARVDANRLEGEGPRRLCYAGSVLRAHPDNYGRSRAPLQIGAEVFGVAGPTADAEVIGLMAATLSEVGIRDFTLDLGHVGLYRALVKALDADADSEARLRDAVRRKDREALGETLEELGADADVRRALEVLPTLHGGMEVLDEARSCAVNTEAAQALDGLEVLVEHLHRRDLGDHLSFDLGEVRGYDYHTGPVFSAYVSGQGEAVFYGGRYDGIGGAFGRSRPATGISGDLKLLADLMPREGAAPAGVLAPAEGPDALQRAIQSLRAQGVRVVQALEGLSEADFQAEARRLGCAQILVHDEGQGWRTKPVEPQADE